jgi:hypothetical protein
MFRIHKSLLLTGTSVFDSSPNYVYSQWVENDISMPWFHVVITTESEGEELKQQVMPGNVEQFEHLLGLVIGNNVSLDVYVVSPPHVNGQEVWSMERLASLYVANTADHYQDWFYTTTKGHVFRDGDGHTLSLENALNVRLIYLRP